MLSPLNAPGNFLFGQRNYRGSRDRAIRINRANLSPFFFFRSTLPVFLVFSPLLRLPLSVSFPFPDDVLFITELGPFSLFFFFSSFFSAERSRRVYEWRFYAHKFHRTEQKDLYILRGLRRRERPDTIFPCKRSSGLLLLAATSRRKLLYALIIDLCFRTDHFRQVSLLLVSSSSSFFSSPGTLDRARSRRLISSVGFPGTERGEKSEFACRAERGRVPLAMQIRKRSVAKQTILDFVNDRVACFWREGEN